MGRANREGARPARQTPISIHHPPVADGWADNPRRLTDMASVLVVDDAAFMRKMVTDALTKGGHDVIGEAGNGTEAVHRYQELRPDLTPLDITMPEKDALAALREIISIDPSAKVIMCSALG